MPKSNNDVLCGQVIRTIKIIERKSYKRESAARKSEQKLERLYNKLFVSFAEEALADIESYHPAMY